MARLEAAVAAAILLLPTATAAVGPTPPAAGEPGPLPADPEAGDLAPADAAAHQWASMAASGPGVQDRAAVARAALDVAETAGEDTSHREILRALQPLVEARLQAGPAGAPSPGDGGTPTLQALQTVPGYLEAASSPPATLEGALDLRAELAPAPAAGEATDLPDVPRFPSLPAALLALYAWYGETPTPEEAERVAGMARLPAEVEAGLTRLVETHLFQARVQATVHGDDGPAASGAAAPPGTGEVDAEDRRLLSAARDVAVQRARDAVDQLHPVEKDVPKTLRVPPYFALELSNADSTYTNNYRFQVDIGGDDEYRNNAGGANTAAGTLVDVLGDDEYGGSSHLAANGAGVLGFGLLLDARGGDTYAVDLTSSGNVYRAVNGGGAGPGGTGALVDLGGDDGYWANLTAAGGFLQAAANGGAYAGGAGSLVDLGGGDTYAANLSAARIEAGVNAGAHSGGLGSVGGYLLDARGGDTYDVVASGTQDGDFGDTSLAATGGAVAGTSILVDGLGDDEYALDVADPDGVELAGQGGGTLGGTGALLEAAGDDTYEAAASSPADQVAAGANGGGFLAGAGLVADRGGDDNYTTSLSTGGGGIFVGAQGGSMLGFGLLEDRAGWNNYTAGTAPGSGDLAGGLNGASEGWNLARFPNVERRIVVPGSLGVLLAGDGNDTYRGPGPTQGSGSFGTGVLADAGGENAYEARPDAAGDGLAQGAGAVGGVGLLVDRGRSAAFDLGAGVAGQGSGLQGLGLLYHAEPGGEARFSAASPSQALSLDGGGTGFVVSLGNITGPDPPTLGCDGYLAGGPQANAGTTLHLCDPEEADKRPIPDPRDGEPLTVRHPITGEGEEGAIWKPTCTGILGSPSTCDTILTPVGQHVNESSRGWLEDPAMNSTTRGALGFLHEGNPGPSEGPASSEVQYALTTVDEGCKFSCFALPS